ncbi:thioredoxin domain-containing protein 5 [Coccinella septempunctata]|uniref:thioredoxin domain-containing protein 5 n=1 Tax=Coccinella septempunctata TaxID=41139 RepID=UPI001D08DBFF|nr:thioredoxin domain-containing protein 5 [Coccinella septempunctata]
MISRSCKMNSLIHCFLIILCLNFEHAFGHEEDEYTVQYTVENYAEELPKRNHFIMFYAPWCGHCRRLAPTWEQLAEMLNEDDSNVRIAKVDCTVDKKICSDEDVTGYPTLKFFKKGNSNGEKFRGPRDLPTLTTFINEQLRGGDEESDTLKAALKKAESASSIELTEENFDSHVKQGKHFVKFYAPWCGHCQQLAPIWQEVAKTFEFDSSLSIAKIDCTKHKSVCTQYEIKAYPTLLWIENGEKVEKYQGSRTHEELVNYIKKMLDQEQATTKEKPEDKKEKSPPADKKEIELTAENFRNTIQTGITFIKFFAPWCGHCKSLAPTWDDLNKKYEPTENIKIMKVDCTAQENKGLCNDEKIDGFPTMYLYKDGEKISEYTGSRSLEDLSDFVQGHVGHDEL